MDPRLVAERYDAFTVGGLGRADHELLVSLEVLSRNYGVFDPVAFPDADRLPVALRELDVEHLRGQRILDYGCGSAKVGVVLAQLGAEVWGFDISLNSVVVGSRRARANGVADRVHLAVMGGDHLGWPSGFFDSVFGYEVLYYLHGKVEFAPEILRVLRPGGKAIFCEALAGNPVLAGARGLLRRATGTINRTGGSPMSLNQIRDTFLNAGAEVVTYPVNLLGMGYRVFGQLPAHSGLRRFGTSFLKRADGWLLDRVPRLRGWCGEVVTVVTKRS